MTSQTAERLTTINRQEKASLIQNAIADYLDAKCAEIDELIKVKQEKIETLKQSLVSAKTYQSIKTMPATPANRRCECPF